MKKRIFAAFAALALLLTGCTAAQTPGADDAQNTSTEKTTRCAS